VATLRDEPDVRDVVFDATELGDLIGFEFDEDERVVDISIDLSDK
jgi:hypothetical protein